MKGKSALIWLGLAGTAGAVLFQTSYEVQSREEQLAGLNRKIVAEQEAIQILKAEWSFLNDPSRLETLARTHLSLRPTEARQSLASADVVPMRPAPAAAPEPAPLPPMAGLPGGSLPSGAYTPAALAKAAVPAPSAAPTTVAAVRAPQPAIIPAKAPGAPQPTRAVAAATAKTPKLQPAVVKSQQPPAQQPQTLQPPARAATTPASTRQQPAPPPKTDTLGVMIARLGSTR